MAIHSSSIVRIYRLSLLILLIIWLRSAFAYWAQIYSKNAQLLLGYYIRRRIFDQLQSLNLNFYSKIQAGDLLNSIIGEVNKIQIAFEVFSLSAIQGLILIAYLISMFLISWQLSTIVIIVFFFLSLGLKALTTYVREASFELPQANKQLSTISLEFISGIRDVHASGTQEFERQRFEKANQQIFDAANKISNLSILVQPLVQGVSSTILIILVVFSFNVLIINGNLKIASLLTFLFALLRVIPALSLLNNLRAKFSGLQGSLGNVNELLRRDNKSYLKDGFLEIHSFNQSINLLSVGFSYNSNDENVLHNITFSIEKGKMTALIGASGAGKTTIADLIPRFYDPTRGKILIDGVDLRELKINSLRRKMAIVSQDTFIFNASVRYNITYGLEAVSDDAVWEAARSANALEFIQELPEKLDTHLGDRGVRLSGGQRQRIAIARAILRNPEILILDEATSAVDTVTERLIQDSLERLSQGRTVLAIAHRLSTIVRADKIVVLEHGEVVEQGNYQALLEQRGKLWQYHQMQYEGVSQ